MIITIYVFKKNKNKKKFLKSFKKFQKVSKKFQKVIFLT